MKGCDKNDIEDEFRSVFIYVSVVLQFKTIIDKKLTLHKKT